MSIGYFLSSQFPAYRFTTGDTKRYDVTPWDLGFTISDTNIWSSLVGQVLLVTRNTILPKIRPLKDNQRASCEILQRVGRHISGNLTWQNTPLSIASRRLGLLTKTGMMSINGPSWIHIGDRRSSQVRTVMVLHRSCQSATVVNKDQQKCVGLSRASQAQLISPTTTAKIHP
jgi:hypothetical protein